MKKLTWLLLFSSFVINLNAAEGDTLSVKWQLYIDWYYKHTTKREGTLDGPTFLYNYRKTGEPSLNLGLANVELQKGRVQAKLGVMAGDYVKYNLNGEKKFAQLFYQANISCQISKNKDLWIEAGIFPSHIGIESAISFDQFNLTRSLAAENSPYYEAGAKVYWKSKEGKYFVNALVLNGWQTTTLETKSPALGFQFTWTPSPRFQINYSNFLQNGHIKPGVTKRLFHNWYLNTKLSGTVDLAAGFDLGYDKYQFGNYHWYTLYSTLKWQLLPESAVGARFEYFNDTKNTIIQGIDYVWSSSFNVDRIIDDAFKFRMEIRWFDASRLYFNNKKSLFMYTLSFCAKLGN